MNDEKQLTNEGRLKIFYGPMYSGKSAYIIKDIFNNMGTSKLVFKPRGDVRSDKLYTREGLEFDAIAINHASEIEPRVKTWVRAVYIDEINFFDGDVVEVIERLLKRGIDVVVSGLDKDFRLEWFPQSKALIEMADVAVKLKARCHVCEKRSSNTARYINGEPASINSPVILSDSLDASVEYLTVCDEHHPFFEMKKNENKQ